MMAKAPKLRPVSIPLDANIIRLTARNNIWCMHVWPQGTAASLPASLLLTMVQSGKHRAVQASCMDQDQDDRDRGKFYS